ncbi:hypothetical protein CC80DRAFT_105392 [Byssothecium circinans]|uniref:Uncharacterized protein n=1 Tax=Byssothecium circinans TaxID=147558 RepID=A0A6A5UDW6_9PLEO|nr:hypothetical protein CC80DRAFT_105392 [Byssothecium circinans]
MSCGKERRRGGREEGWRIGRKLGGNEGMGRESRETEGNRMRREGVQKRAPGVTMRKVMTHRRQNSLSSHHSHRRRNNSHHSSSPESRYTAAHKGRAEANAQSRGERLARQVSDAHPPTQNSHRSHSPSPSSRSPLPPPPPQEPYHLTPEEEAELAESPAPQVRFRTRTSSIRTRLTKKRKHKVKKEDSNPPPRNVSSLDPVYEGTRHSQSVEDRERAQAEQTSSLVDPISPSNPDTNRQRQHDYSADHSGNVDEYQRNLHSNHHYDTSQRPLNRDALAARDAEGSTLVSDWWSVRSDTPTDDGRHSPRSSRSPTTRGRSRDMSSADTTNGDDDRLRHMRVPEQGTARDRSTDTDGGSVLGRLSAHVDRDGDRHRKDRP